MPLTKGDFIEIEFIGNLQNGEVFDSNISEELKKINPNFNKNQAKPFTLCLGESMFLKGVEDYLVGKEIGEYVIELTADKAFGNRDTKLISKVPLKIFHEQKINPIPGSAFNFDGKIGKILTTSGGRVLVDFNNPLAGKDIIYKVKVLRKINDLNKKASALNEFLFRKEIDFTINDKKLTLKLDKQMSQFAILFKDKYKDMLGLDLEVDEIEEKPKASQKK